MEIKSCMVVGTGQMGSGIAQVCLEAGCKVLFYDEKAEAVQKAIAKIDKLLDRRVEKGKLSAEQKNTMMANITVITDLKEAYDVDLVIEAIIEQMEAKQAIHAKLDKALKPEAILGSCTSALPISEMSSATSRPNKFIGIHFHNPVPVMKLVEIIRGMETDDATNETVTKFMDRVHKTPVVVKDVPGFITNRIKIPESVEAIRALAEGIVAGPEDIDTAFKTGFNYPLGPLELCDFVGNDTMLHIMDDLYASYGDTKFFAPPLLRKMVALGYLGRKSGRGFYDYSKEPTK